MEYIVPCILCTVVYANCFKHTYKINFHVDIFFTLIGQLITSFKWASVLVLVLNQVPFEESFGF